MSSVTAKPIRVQQLHLPIGIYRVTSAVAVSGAVDDSANAVQWTYTVTQVHKANAGYGGWRNKLGGYVGTAYNLLEDGNGTGQQDNGVDHGGADYPAGFSLQSLVIGSLHAGLWLRTADAELASTGTAEVWLFGHNAEDGTCS